MRDWVITPTLSPPPRPGGGQAGGNPGHSGRGEPAAAAQRPALHPGCSWQTQGALQADGETLCTPSHAHVTPPPPPPRHCPRSSPRHLAAPPSCRLCRCFLLLHSAIIAHCVLSSIVSPGRNVTALGFCHHLSFFFFSLLHFLNGATAFDPPPPPSPSPPSPLSVTTGIVRLPACVCASMKSL